MLLSHNVREVLAASSLLTVELSSCMNSPLPSVFGRTAWQNWWTPPFPKCRWSAAPVPHRSIQHTPGRDSGDCYPSSSSLSLSLFQWCYHKISGDGRLLHPVEGTLRRGAGLEVEYGLHHCLADVWVPASHHEELLVWCVTLWLFGAGCLVNGWGHHGGVESFRVAGVGNVGRVWGRLRTEKISKNNWSSILGPWSNMIKQRVLMFLLWNYEKHLSVDDSIFMMVDY